MAQMPLYQNMPFNDPYSWWLCFRASLGDGVIILIIWAIGAVLLRRVHWYELRRPASVTILLLSGAVIAVGIELHALATDRWAYTKLMPLIPLADVGVSPFIQLLFLPWISMALAGRKSGVNRSELKRSEEF